MATGKKSVITKDCRRENERERVFRVVEGHSMGALIIDAQHCKFIGYNGPV